MYFSDKNIWITVLNVLKDGNVRLADSDDMKNDFFKAVEIDKDSLNGCFFSSDKIFTKGYIENGVYHITAAKDAPTDKLVASSHDKLAFLSILKDGDTDFICFNTRNTKKTGEYSVIITAPSGTDYVFNLKDPLNIQKYNNCEFLFISSDVQTVTENKKIFDLCDISYSSKIKSARIRSFQPKMFHYDSEKEAVLE